MTVKKTLKSTKFVCSTNCSFSCDVWSWFCCPTFVQYCAFVVKKRTPKWARFLQKYLFMLDWFICSSLFNTVTVTVCEKKIWRRYLNSLIKYDTVLWIVKNEEWMWKGRIRYILLNISPVACILVLKFGVHTSTFCASQSMEPTLYSSIKCCLVCCRPCPWTPYSLSPARWVGTSWSRTQSGPPPGPHICSGVWPSPCTPRYIIIIPMWQLFLETITDAEYRYLGICSHLC